MSILWTPELPNPTKRLYFQGWSGYAATTEIPNWSISGGSLSSTRPRKLACNSATFIPPYVKNFSLGFRVFAGASGDILDLNFSSYTIKLSIQDSLFRFGTELSSTALGAENYVEIVYESDGTLHLLIDGLYAASQLYGTEELVTLSLKNGTFSDFYISEKGRVGPCRIYQGELNSETSNINFAGSLSDVDEAIRNDSDFIRSVYDEFEYFTDIKSPSEGVPAYYNYKVRSRGSNGNLVIKNGLKDISLKLAETEDFQWSDNVAIRDQSVV
jgi:hypothetical protein